MSLPDTNVVLRTYLVADPALAPLVGTRIYCPAAPENATLPNITFFTRGGRATPYIPDMPNPSVQIDAWADDPIEARSIYRAIYDALQGIQNVPVVIGINTYYIVSAEEEVQGQDLVDIDIPGRYRCISFWSVQIK